MPGEDFLTLAQSAVDAGGAIWVRVKGSSMVPAIPPGATVRIAGLDGTTVVPGDVVLARRRDGRPVLHRVRSSRGATVVLKGDNHIGVDPPLQLDAVIGRADLVAFGGAVRPLGRVPSWAPRRAVARWIEWIRRWVRNG